MRRYWVVYLISLVLVGGATLQLVNYGTAKFSNRNLSHQIASERVPVQQQDLKGVMKQSLHRPFTLFLLQILIIFPAAYFFGVLFRKWGQPAVIGEIVAGIFLGPSLLGWIAPRFYEFLFPLNSLGTLRSMSQIGILIFMFLVGLELDLESLKRQARDAVFISHAGILFPFFLAVIAAHFYYVSYAPQGISFLIFALFMGIAMSITAFPVLARILQDKGLISSDLGLIALAAASIDDMTAWSVFAIIVAVAESSSILTACWSILFFILFVFVMFLLIKPLVAKILKKDLLRPHHGSIALSLLLVFISSFATEVMGIHALFGAFLAGVIMPKTEVFRKFLSERLEYFAAAFLLPIFFSVTGLRTKTGLLTDFQSLGACISLIAVAVLGKLGGTFAAARYLKMDWRKSLTLGALMNTRGLMELIVLNIAYEMGIFPDRLFTIMVLMAIVTTVMAGPLVDFFSPRVSLRPIKGTR